MAQNGLKLRTLAVAFCSYSFLTACSGSQEAPVVQSPESAGTVNFGLQLAGGQSIQSAAYTIIGPNSFTKSGTIDLSSATKLSATIGGLPAGAGYSISMTANAADGSVNCAGSASFNVLAHATVSVPVAL